jgi:hypothetical protein
MGRKQFSPLFNILAAIKWSVWPAPESITEMLHFPAELHAAPDQSAGETEITVKLTFCPADRSGVVLPSAQVSP